MTQQLRRDLHQLMR